VHRLVDAPPWIGDDAVSLVLFGDAARVLLEREPQRFHAAPSARLRAHVLARSAFAEERLRAAIARGVRQHVSLGAGFDTFAFRQPAWMDGVRMFEVDAPATQRDKDERLARAGFAKPPNLTYVPADFERTSLASALASAGFEPNAPAFFTWLGVMMYLTRPAIDVVFRFVAALPQGTEIAFTFSEPDADGSEELAARVASAGEPFVTRLAASEVEAMLHDYGFGSMTILSLESVRALLGNRTDALGSPLRRGLASATVTSTFRSSIEKFTSLD
jgi:methyltransferase (TIGR00027 family)